MYLFNECTSLLRKITNENVDKQIDMDFLDLWIKMVHTNFQLENMAIDIFKRRQYKIEIDRQSSINGIVDGNRLIISNDTIILKALKLFGSSIQHLNIVNKWEDTKPTAEMNRLINENLCNSLIHFEVLYIYNDTFEQFIGPFKAIDELHFTINDKFKTLLNGTLELNQLFPKLRRLSVELRGYADWAFINCAFPNLKDLTINLYEIEWHEMNEINELLKKNAQIQIASFRQLPQNYIQLISKYLPNLENLTIDATDIGERIVHFKCVKHLRLRNSDAVTIGKLSFSNLESLHMEYIPTYSNEWTNFVERNSNLSRLHVELNWKEYELEFLKFVTKLVNLSKLSIEAMFDIDVERIKRIINRHNKMVKLDVEIHYPKDYGVSIP